MRLTDGADTPTHTLDLSQVVAQKIEERNRLHAAGAATAAIGGVREDD